MGIKKGKTIFVSIEYLMNIQSDNYYSSFLKLIHGSCVYGILAYDEDVCLHCLQPTQHSWVLNPNFIKAHVVMVCKATRLPP
jgi:hypothetical protein